MVCFHLSLSLHHHRQNRHPCTHIPASVPCARMPRLQHPARSYPSSNTFKNKGGRTCQSQALSLILFSGGNLVSVPAVVNRHGRCPARNFPSLRMAKPNPLARKSSAEGKGFAKGPGPILLPWPPHIFPCQKAAFHILQELERRSVPQGHIEVIVPLNNPKTRPSTGRVFLHR